MVQCPLTQVSGQRMANGQKVTPSSLTAVSAYVQQDDLFFGGSSLQLLVLHTYSLPQSPCARQLDCEGAPHLPGPGQDGQRGAPPPEDGQGGGCNTGGQTNIQVKTEPCVPSWV